MESWKHFYKLAISELRGPSFVVKVKHTVFTKVHWETPNSNLKFEPFQFHKSITNSLFLPSLAIIIIPFTLSAFSGCKNRDAAVKNVLANYSLDAAFPPESSDKHQTRVFCDRTGCVCSSRRANRFSAVCLAEREERRKARFCVCDVGWLYLDAATPPAPT